MRIAQSTSSIPNAQGADVVRLLRTISSDGQKGLVLGEKHTAKKTQLSRIERG
jgi:hypothetical protein